MRFRPAVKAARVIVPATCLAGAAKTIRTYTEAVQYFAAATWLPGQPSRASWEQVSSGDIQRWMTWLLDRYSSAYASNQYRALQQFFKWLAAEDQLPSQPRLPATYRPANRSPESLNGRLCESPKAFGAFHRNPTSQRPGPPPRDPTDTTAFRGTPRHSC